MAGAPLGNKNGSKKNRMLSDALKRELTQNPEDVVAIVRKLIDQAKAGEPWAQSLIHDRVDGKAIQTLDATVEGGEGILGVLAGLSKRNDPPVA